MGFVTDDLHRRVLVFTAGLFRSGFFWLFDVDTGLPSSLGPSNLGRLAGGWLVRVLFRPLFEDDPAVSAALLFEPVLVLVGPRSSVSEDPNIEKTVVPYPTAKVVVPQQVYRPRRLQAV